MTDPVVQFREKKKAKGQALIRVGVWVLAGLVGLMCLLIGVLYLGPGPTAQSGDKSIFVVRAGDGVSTVTDRLYEGRLIRSKLAFRAVAMMSGASGNLKPAEYEIPSRSSPGKIADIISSGRGVRRSVTLPEGWSVSQIYTRLQANTILTGDLPPPPPEGSLNPDTYIIQAGDTRAEIVKRMRDSHDDMLEELWLKRAPDLPIRTKEEAVTLASIVEKETGIAEERPRVAAVFVNRLRKGMKLQSDPTIIYGITKGAPLRRKIFKSDLENPHPWNTYVINALPPTPIANPGRASIAAVLNPPASKELFFVADGTGGHVFAETYAEHNRNVQRWREFRAKAEAKDADLAGSPTKGEAQDK
jgi:UPF0755 protein